jgi:hypothetical protein
VRPRIAICGDAEVLFTPELNDAVLERVRAEGCNPVLPAAWDLLASSAPLADAAGKWYGQGIRDIIFVQCFGCLNSHVFARGMVGELKERYPGLAVTFLDYDPGTSRVNQVNRIKLACAVAREHAYINEYREA